MSYNRNNRFSAFYRYLVKNTWQYVSNLGTGYGERLSTIKSNTLVNQINFVLAGTMLILLIILMIRLQIIDKEISIGVMRVFYTFLLCVLNLLLAIFSFRKISRDSLIFISPLVFMIIPSFLGFVEDEGYFYNGYVLIAASIIPQLILSPIADRKTYWFAMVYYFVLIISIDKISMEFQKESRIVDHLRDRDLFFIDKLAQVFIFLFINLSIYYLRRSNLRFEERLKVQNQVLNKQNTRIRENREEILQQKQLIEENNKAITDSITYARFIQASILPKYEQLNSCLKDYFLFSRPAEIVSGDFHWVSEIMNKSVITVADCTGHGVPGAFMSMLGITLLDEIVNKEFVTQPHIILDRLRKELINSLKQKGDFAEVKDGMDIALCVLDKDKRKLAFSGANNPLYLIRKKGYPTQGIIHDESDNDSLFLEIKGDSMPVGISYDMSGFTQNEIDIYEGDTFYMFTDGFPDQFGGPNHKKLSYKLFREHLMKTKSGKMHEQAVKLEKVLHEWMGCNNQTDDILVVGFRIDT